MTFRSLLLLVAGLVPLPAQAQAAEDALWNAPERVFSVPSESMSPTLNPGDGVIATRVAFDALKRGDVIAFRKGGPRQIWLFRLIGLPGDVVAMRDGAIVLNDETIPQKFVGVVESVSPFGRLQSARKLEERLADGGPVYHILDLEAGRMDNSPPVKVPAGHVFVLGDNRDNAADSRVSGEWGAGLVEQNDIYGVVTQLFPGTYPATPPPPRSDKAPVVIVPDRSSRD
ncbi:MAG: signal peptidase I [Alphaproteobacteria bacterium HGW-Alphaproteobacteria-16]|nr:MAG: signal peptidase I [Alphaproteobacteria bacterium HGW-Alphaproteobacteria-16]